MLLEGLNEMQKEAVLKTEGPLLIIAGAGSGKTKALTHRIAYLICEKKVAPNHILAVTFTNKAANEMKERVKHLLPHGESRMPLMGTFHSICVRILRKEIHHLNYENSFVIYDGNDSLSLVKRIFKEKHIDEKQFYPKAVLGAISNAKNALVEPKDYLAFAPKNTFYEAVNDIYKLYQRELQKAYALDFDDIIMRTVELFQTCPEILDKYQEIFRYISVDEYQDTNNAQYQLIKMLADKYRNICVIGDDWQSIYSWRGANIQNILSFERDYPDAKVIKLEQNYRSPKTIVEAANAVIARNTMRTDKVLWTEKENDEKIFVQETLNERDEGEKILDSIEELRRGRGISYSDMAILYRTNAQSRMLEDCLLMRGIPYRIVGGVRFYERKEIKDMLAYLRVILNPKDSVSLLRIINTPSRKIGAKTIEILQEYAMQKDTTLYDAIDEVEQNPLLENRSKKVLLEFAALLHEFSRLKTEVTVAGLLKHIITLTKYQQFIQDGTEEGEERFRNIAELVNVAAKYDVLEPGVSLSTFLEEVALVSDTDTLVQDQEAVTLMTLHSSKGLEYGYVFIAGLEEGIFPSTRTQMDPHELEEERRLMYVGMTRAMEKLYLSFTKSRMLYGDYQYNAPSRFLSEIPPEFVEERGKRFQLPSSNTHFTQSGRLIEEPRVVVEEEEGMTLEPGARINHKSWGMGTVIEQYKEKITVVFDNPMIGRKVLLAQLAPIERVLEWD